MSYAEKKKSFILYNNYEAQFDAMSDEAAGRLIKATFDYHAHLIDPDKRMPPEEIGVEEKATYAMICERMEIDLDKWMDKSAKNTESANKRWHPNECERIHPLADSDSDSDSDILLKV